MFDDWMAQTNQYVQKHIDRRFYHSIAEELDADIVEMSELYTTILLNNGIIDENGEETGLDYDEDDLLEDMLTRFLTRHLVDDERELLYATLIDSYLALVQLNSEDA